MKNSVKKRTLIVLLGRYPTEKAYGITTRYTVESLRTLGVTPYTISFQNHDRNHKSRVTMSFYESQLARFFRINSYRSFGIVSILCWQVVIRLAMRQLCSVLSEVNPTLIWIRDARILRYTRRCGDQLIHVLEIHDNVNSKLEKRLRNIDPSRIVLAPISKVIEAQLVEHIGPQYKIVLSPMGINPKQFEHKNKIRNMTTISKDAPLVVGYFGKLAPNGYSKGVEDLLNLIIHHNEIDFPSKLHIVGLTKLEKLKISEFFANQNIPESRYRIEEHLPHNEVISKMMECDVLVLPGQEGPYVGSPIKGVEYSATGRPIVAANSIANLSLFDEEFQPFWYEKGNIDSLHGAILDITKSSELDDLARKSVAFAKKRTWLTRTSRLLDSTHGFTVE